MISTDRLRHRNILLVVPRTLARTVGSGGCNQTVLYIGRERIVDSDGTTADLV